MSNLTYLHNQTNYTLPLTTISVSINSATELERIKKGKRIRCKFSSNELGHSEEEYYKKFSKLQQSEFDRFSSTNDKRHTSVHQQEYEKFILAKIVSKFILIEIVNHLVNVNPSDHNELISCIYFTILDESDLKLVVECDSYILAQTISIELQNFINELSDFGIESYQLGDTFSQFASPFHESNDVNAINKLYSQLDSSKRKLYSVQLMNLPTFEIEPEFDIPQKYRVHIELSKNEVAAIKAEIGITAIS